MASLAETLGYLANPKKGKKMVKYSDWVANNPERSGFPKEHYEKLTVDEISDDEYLPDLNDRRWKR